MTTAPQSVSGFSGRDCQRWLPWVVFVAVLGVFLPALHNGFINLDDGIYVTSNPHVQAGLTAEGFRWAFRTFDSANWHPMTWLSLMLDAQLFGAQAWGFHLTSALLHAANAALVFVLLRCMTGAVWRSVLVALLFGLHPLRVESVAWVAERKDVLSTLFGLLSLLAYVAWKRPAGADGGQRRWVYGAASLGALALGLMSKPMLVTLPCVLLLLDFWPLQRTEFLLKQAWPLVREKWLFFLLAAGGAASTWVAQASLGAMGNASAYPLASRLANALEAYAAYLGKTLWPTELAVIYPFRVEHGAGSVAAAGVLLAAITAATFWGRRKHPYLLTGWLWFVGTLVPVIGLVQVGGQAMADRYTYLPAIGLLLALVWGAAVLVAERRSLRWAGAMLAGAAAVVLATLTVRQIARWKDSETLFRHTLAVTERNYFAHNALGLALARQEGRRAEAIAQFRVAARIVPGLPEARLQLAAALSEAGPEALPECIAEYRMATRLDPRDAEAQLGLAMALRRTPDGLDEAIAALLRTIELQPEHADAHFTLAECLASRPEGGEEALAAFRTVLRLRPERVEVRNSIGLLLARAGRYAEAIAEYEAVLRVKPDFAPAHNNLANVLVRLEGREAEALVHYRAAVALAPEFWEARFNLGLVLAGDPRSTADAIAQFEAVLRLRPDLAPAREMLTQLRGE